MSEFLLIHGGHSDWSIFKLNVSGVHIHSGHAVFHPIFVITVLTLDKF